MGRGKYDNCSNCIYVEYNKKLDVYICSLDKKEIPNKQWCKYHKSEDDEE